AARRRSPRGDAPLQPSPRPLPVLGAPRQRQRYVLPPRVGPVDVRERPGARPRDVLLPRAGPPLAELLLAVPVHPLRRLARRRLSGSARPAGGRAAPHREPA